MATSYHALTDHSERYQIVENIFDYQFFKDILVFILACPEEILLLFLFYEKNKFYADGKGLAGVFADQQDFFVPQVATKGKVF